MQTDSPPPEPPAPIDRSNGRAVSDREYMHLSSKHHCKEATFDHELVDKDIIQCMNRNKINAAFFSSNNQSINNSASQDNNKPLNQASAENTS